MPPVSASPILWIAFPGLIWLLDTTRTRIGAFALGWSFGFGFFVVGLYWISFALSVDFARFWWVLPFSVTGLPALLAVFTGLATLAARAVPMRGLARILWFAACWAAFEWVRGHVLTGFPWNLVGYTWVDWLPLLQGSAVIGIYGLSLVTVLVAALPAAMVDPGSRTLLRRGIAGAAAGLLGLGLLGLWGAWRIPEAPVAHHPGVSLRLVQPNIAQVDKWDRTQFADHFALHRELSLAPGSPTHVIWPETAIPYQLTRDENARLAIALSTPPGGVTLTGAPRIDDAGATPRYWNSLFAVDDRGEIVATYDKAHLVPFGEYSPLPDWLPFVAIASSANYSAGPGPRTLDVPGLPPVSPLICYEAIFPGAVTDERAGAVRPDWLLNISNDGWYGVTAGPHQHFALAQTRAVEEGLPLVRVANTGVSGVVDPYGRILERTALGRQEVIDSVLPLPLDDTPPYGRFGDWAFALVLVVAAGSAAITFILKRNNVAR